MAALGPLAELCSPMMKYTVSPIPPVLQEVKSALVVLTAHSPLPTAVSMILVDCRQSRIMIIMDTNPFVTTPWQAARGVIPSR